MGMGWARGWDSDSVTGLVMVKATGWGLVRDWGRDLVMAKGRGMVTVMVTRLGSVMPT